MTTVETSQCRIGVVDDHALLAQTVALALGERGYATATLQPESTADIVSFARVEALDVVLLDLDLGSAGTSLEIIGALRSLGCKVVIVTGQVSEVALGACIEAGADEVITKTLSFDELIDRVARVVEGLPARANRNELLATMRQHREAERQRLEPFTRLTAREADVLHDLMQGLSAEEIAATRYVSIATVRSHIRAILQKLHVNSQLAAVAFAVQRGWSVTFQR